MTNIDFQNTGAQFVNIAAGETSAVVEVQTFADQTAEGDEQFSVALNFVRSGTAQMVDPIGVGTLHDNTVV